MAAGSMIRVQPIRSATWDSHRDQRNGHQCKHDAHQVSHGGRQVQTRGRVGGNVEREIGAGSADGHQAGAQH